MGSVDRARGGGGALEFPSRSHPGRLELRRAPPDPPGPELRPPGLGQGAASSEATSPRGRRSGSQKKLHRLAVEAGLPAHEVAEVLATDRFAAEVRDDEQRARLLGINGVPFFAIDDRYGVSGAQSADVLLEALTTAWLEHAPDATAVEAPWVG